MDIGDHVIVYDHETDGNRSFAANDRLGFINGPVAEDGSAPVVIFPVGGPVQFARLRPFNPEYPFYYYGETFYRDGGDPPDFGPYFGYPVDPEWNALIAKQRREYETTARTAEQTKEMYARHVAERKELAQKLTPKYAKEKPNA